MADYKFYGYESSLPWEQETSAMFSFERLPQAAYWKATILLL